MKLTSSDVNGIESYSFAGLETVPVHSLKSYFGHTLGASGVIESIICIHELKENVLFGTLGYEKPGVSMPILVQADHQEIPMKHCIKTASGFGGCNAAIVLTLPAYQKQPSRVQVLELEIQQIAIRIRRLR